MLGCMQLVSHTGRKSKQAVVLLFHFLAPLVQCKWRLLSIGVARIFSGGALFLPEKVDDPFLVVALKRLVKTNY